MQELSEINGTVSAVIFRNDENGYGVVKLELDSGENVTAVGCLPYIAPGEMISAEGSWMTHAQHGRQFKIEQCSRLLPTSAEAIYEYLAGGTVRGVGPATAALIVDRFGDKALDVLEMQPEKLAEIKGISSAKAKDISAGFKKQAGVRRLTEFLCSYGIQPIFALRMFKFYGNSAIEVVHENPYILSSSHIGASFAEADSLALALGLEGDSLNRVCAAVVFELVHNSGNGHCFIPRGKLTLATSQLIGVAQELAEDAVDKLAETGEIVCCTVAGLDACYLAPLYEAETYTAGRIKAMCKAKTERKVDITSIISRLEAANNIEYAPMQREAIALAAQNRMLVITGGPGTGKTTILKAVLALYDELELETYLAAPTGRAAKRMSELCGMEASTIHRMLGAKMSEDGETVVFGKGEEDKLACDALIIDECSMVDITLMHAILKALKSDCRILLVGDADQLPSVGPGNVFSDIIRSGVVPTVRLTEIFRQKADSRIVRNAHMINRGKHPDFNENSGDFFRLRRMQGGSCVETIVELCKKRLPENMKIPSNQIQVLSPSRKGETGTVNLNKCLQAALNPSDEKKKEKLFGETVFRVGDRVIQIKNNYDIVWKDKLGKSGMGVYNGDIGTIIEIDTASEYLKVDYDDKIALYGFEMLNELEHAWALTVHKSQGSEYRAVILSLNPVAQLLLTRGVLYTAVTRAKELLIMVGDENVAHRMIDNHKQSRRYSALRIRLADENS
ncbi:MAG: ATP-dependent RecD-like DNA helicase [Oscillospiraceae bacterium]|nr:ATP-dependent RecD-like DNA helicase [Oscillospiraceae bacterium]